MGSGEKYHEKCKNVPSIVFNHGLYRGFIDRMREKKPCGSGTRGKYGDIYRHGPCCGNCHRHRTCNTITDNYPDFHEKYNSHLDIHADLHGHAGGYFYIYCYRYFDSYIHIYGHCDGFTDIHADKYPHGDNYKDQHHNNDTH